MSTAFWEDHYGRRPQVWSGRPNAVLVDEVAGLPPGSALDLGCGEGADAVWLAVRGWRVTAVDVSQTALDRAARAAVAAGVDALVDWQRHDLADTFPAGWYDLVSAQFLQSPVELPSERILRQAAGAVAPGGTLLVVTHAAPPPWAEHHDHHGDLPGPDDTAAAIGLQEDGWVLVVCELREREATGPNGEQATLKDSVVKARRG